MSTLSFVTLAEAKEYLNITNNNFDLKVSSGVASVSGFIKDYTGISPVQTSTENDPQLRNVAFKLIEIDFLSIGGKYISGSGVAYDISHKGMPKNLKAILDTFAKKQDENAIETVFGL